MRLYGRDYLDRLREAGFEVELRPYADELGEAATRRFGLAAHDDLVVCRR